MDLNQRLHPSGRIALSLLHLRPKSRNRAPEWQSLSSLSEIPGRAFAALVYNASTTITFIWLPGRSHLLGIATGKYTENRRIFDGANGTIQNAHSYTSLLSSRVGLVSLTACCRCCVILIPLSSCPPHLITLAHSFTLVASRFSIYCMPLSPKLIHKSVNVFSIRL